MTTLLRLRDVSVHFGIGGWMSRTTVRAVDGVDLSMQRGETLALVGESGCGKTTLARTVSGLRPPTKGTVELFVEEATPLSRRRQIQMVFQDPYASMNPLKTASATLKQPLRIHATVPRSSREAEIRALLDMVGLHPADEFMARYPHQLSGGQRQRVAIARAIAPRPSLLVADEPVSSLDISVRAQILELMLRLQREFGLACLFITHDLAVVRSLADRVAVMYRGCIAEHGSVEDLFTTPRHPYTLALLLSTPIPDPVRARARPLRVIEGELPSAAGPVRGCRFHSRCWLRGRLGNPEACETTEPPAPAAEPGDRGSACHFADRAEAAAVEMLGAALATKEN